MSKNVSLGLFLLMYCTLSSPGQEPGCFYTGITFHNNGKCYSVYETCPDTEGGKLLFPFKVNAKTYNLAGKLVSSPEFASDNLVGVKNDTIYYINNSKDDDSDSSTINEINVKTKESQIICDLPFNIGSNPTSYNAKENTTTFINTKNLSILYIVDFNKKELRSINIEFIKGKLQGKEITDISALSDDTLLINCVIESEDNSKRFEIFVYDLISQKLIYKRKIKAKSCAAGFLDGNVISFCSYKDKKGSYEIFNIGRNKIIYNNTISETIEPERFEIYKNGSSVSLLLTYLINNSQLSISKADDETKLSLTFSDYGVKLFTLDTLLNK